MRPNLEAAAMVSKSRNQLPVVIQKYAPINKDYASVIFTLAAGSQEVATEERVNAALGNIYGNRVRLCEGTLAKNSIGNGVMQCIVAQNAETVPYETASTSGWTVVAANQFADDSDNLWEVGGEGESRVLRRLGNDDLTAILEERRSRSMATACVGIDLVPEVARHDSIMFYDTQRQEVAFGIVVGKNKVFTSKEEVRPFEAAAVMHHEERDPHIEFANAPDVEAASMSTVLEYYKRLYGHNVAFYNELKSLIQTHLQLAA